MRVAGRWTPVAKHWSRVAGRWTLDAGHRSPVARHGGPERPTRMKAGVPPVLASHRPVPTCARQC
ncbi:hypothetical protein BN2475_400024 [Paraburkholderia ribeironis]|uniref:Uncharacterized protein n=1 Tax=Paraburkholderia ribeironis TaxID=1247936 RepID=A0A1N7S6N0_9BURK|nr:hypothetical protein BN2475_400024 [Paraburkholderia ribeironis]